ATPVFVASTTTDANGAYSFDLQPGDYLVCEVLKSLYTQRSEARRVGKESSAVAAGGLQLTGTSSRTSAGNDFGNYTTGSVSGVKFEDHNANGVRSVRDPGRE